LKDIIFAFSTFQQWNFREHSSQIQIKNEIMKSQGQKLVKVCTIVNRTT
jgi:hypothetical protein